MINRYSRQILFSAIGTEGQKKLNNSFAVVVGCGALGTVAASGLVRAGVGKVRLIDRDFIEYHNLQRQILFDEADIKDNLPKAVAAARHLKKINSSIEVEGVVSDVNYTNIEKLVQGADVIVDGLDNFETRFLINDFSLKHNISWVYGGAIASLGMVMTIIPRKTPCFSCISSGQNVRQHILTCDTVGVISPAPWIIGSLQVVEAMKILIETQEIEAGLIVADVWKGDFQRLKVIRKGGCPACEGKYEYLEGKYSTKTSTLCGQNAVQVLGPGNVKVSFEELNRRLNKVGKVNYNEFMMQFNVDSHEMVIFPDGRAIIKNTTDESYSRSLYAKYIGA